MYNPVDQLSNNTNGVSLYGIRISYNIINDDPVVYLNNVSNAILTTAIINDAPNQWGINIQNHSWGLDSVYSENFYYNSNEMLLRDAVHFINRLGGTFVASRGNVGPMSAYGARHIPACYDDDWVLNIGGSDRFGEYITNSMYGENVDVIAPSFAGNIYSTSRKLHATDTLKYYEYSGTSASAPHVSGVAALILSYHNQPISWYHNLSQEDVEFIIQMSARDAYSIIGYDGYTGHGLLQADEALKFIEKPKRYVKHYGTNDSSSFSRSVNLLFFDTVVKFSETSETDSGQVINPHISYRADVYNIETVVNHSIVPTANILYAWPRHSASYTARIFDDSSYVEPHEKDSIITYSQSSATLTGNVYKLKDMSGNFIGWYPTDTTASMEYSMLLYDSTLTTGIYETQMQEWGLTLYPNPAVNGHTMVIDADVEGCEVEIRLYDIQGKMLNNYNKTNLRQGRNVFNFDISDLSSGMYFYKAVMNNKACSVKFNKL